MWVEMREMSRLIALRWPRLVVAGGVAGGLWMLEFRMHLHAGRRRREKRIEEELAAYARLDMRLAADGDGLELAQRVSRSMAEKSAFHRAAMLIRGEDGRLSVAASAGMDASTVQLLDAWGVGIVTAERSSGRSVRREESAWGCA